MDKGSRLRFRTPSPAMVVALIALVFAMTGTAFAAGALVNGDKLIKKSTLSGNRLRPRTVTGKQVDLTKLGTVPTAVRASSAAKADSAITAAPSGAAGGALSGTYPAPSLAAGAVSAGELATFPGAAVGRSAGQSIVSDTRTPIQFTTEDRDDGGLFDAGQPTRLTAPIAGRYLITAAIEWAPSVAGIRWFGIYSSASSGPCAFTASPAQTLGGYGTWQTATTVHRFKAGDYVTLEVGQTSGVATSVLGVTGSGALSPAFTMDWIGR